MRTTLILNDELAEAAKKKAAERKMSLSAVVNEALRFSLHQKDTDSATEPFRMTTYAPKGATARHLDARDIHELLVAEELDPYQT